MHAGQSESGGRMVKGRVHPVRRVMAGIARLREVRADVVRVRRGLEILQVAVDAGRARQVVIIVDVAIDASARRNGVQAGQSKARSGVIELTVGPQNGVVTLFAGCRESRVRNRRGGVVEIGLVAADARNDGDVVVVVDVAISTLPRRNGVRTSQREA